MDTNRIMRPVLRQNEDWLDRCRLPPTWEARKTHTPTSIHTHTASTYYSPTYAHKDFPGVQLFSQAGSACEKGSKRPEGEGVRSGGGAGMFHLSCTIAAPTQSSLAAF